MQSSPSYSPPTKATLPVIKRNAGLILLCSYFIVGINAAVFLGLQAISEVDLVLILSPFGTSAFVAQNFFDSLTFGDISESRYGFTQKEFDFFLKELQREIDYAIDRRAQVVIRKSDFDSLRETIIKAFNSQENLKFFPGTIIAEFDRYVGAIANDYPSGTLSQRQLGYFIQKFVDWISERKTYDSNRPFSPTAYWLILLSVLITPTIPLTILWLRALGILDLTQELLGTVSTIATGTAIGFWGTTVSKMGEGGLR